MKKVYLTITIISLLVSESFAQTYKPFLEGDNGKIYRDAQNSSFDRGDSGGTTANSKFGEQGQYSIDLTISGWTPTQAADSWTGPDHSGMGATGVGAFTAGFANRASGANAVVFGLHNVAGQLNTASSTSWDISDLNPGGQLAFGYGNQATGNLAFSGGEGTTASGAHSFSFGENTVASGSYSTVIGFETDASDYGSLVMGQYNSSGSSVTNNATSFSTSNTAFVIGNGVDSSNKSDAFKVMFNGNTTIGGDDLTIGDLSAFSGSFTQRSAIDVVAHSDGDLMTGYINGSTGDRFNIELDASNSLAKISSGGGYDLTFSTEGGTMNFESNGFGTGTYAFNGKYNSQ